MRCVQSEGGASGQCGGRTARGCLIGRVDQVFEQTARKIPQVVSVVDSTCRTITLFLQTCRKAIHARFPEQLARGDAPWRFVLYALVVSGLGIAA